MNRPIRIMGAFASIALALVLTACKPEPILVDAPPLSITVAHPIEQQIIDTDEYTGHVEAVDYVEVRARVSGYMQKVHFKDGQLVKKGDVLFTIDPRPYEAETKRTEGEVVRLKARVDRLSKDANRAKKLFERQAASQEEIDKVVGDLAEATGELAAAEAANEKAQLDLSFTRVIAEVDGRISRNYVTVGNLVSAGGAGGEGTLLTTIVSTNPMYVYCDASEANVLKYQRLQREGKRENARDENSRIPMFIGLADEEGCPHEGHIDFVDNRIDPDTGTLRARGVFDNSSGYLTPGMFVRIEVPGSNEYTALLIPERAIGSDQGIRYVYVVNDKNVVETRDVKVGTRHGSLRVIESGLAKQDRVVTQAMARVRPGMIVEPRLVDLEPAPTVGAATAMSLLFALPERLTNL